MSFRRNNLEIGESSRKPKEMEMLRSVSQKVDNLCQKLELL